MQRSERIWYGLYEYLSTVCRRQSVSAYPDDYRADNFTGSQTNVEKELKECKQLNIEKLGKDQI